MGKKTPMETAMICALSFLAVVVVYKLGIFAHELIQNGLQAWEEAPKSTKFFYYGLGVALINAGIVFGVGHIFHDNIELWIAATKIVWSMLIFLMALCWMVAIFYGFLEKIGGLTL